MKKSLIAICIFFITVSTQAVNLNSEGIVHPIIYHTPSISYDYWGKDFYKYLINSKSVEMQSAGVALYNAHGYTEVEQISKYLDKLLPQKLNKESLYILSSTCGKFNKHKATCEKHDYYNRLIKNDVQNLDLYIEGLFQMKIPENSKQITSTIEKVKKSTHASSYNGYFMIGIKKELINFFKLYPNPLTQPYPLFKKNYIKLPAKEKKETIVNKLAQIFNSRLPSGPYYYVFFNQCNNKNTTKAETKLCKHVIDILINKSDSEIRKNVGYYFQAEMELSTNENRSVENEMANSAIIANSKIKLISKCEANPGLDSKSKKTYDNYMKVHPLYLNTIIDNINKVGWDKAYTLGYLALKKYLVANSLVEAELLQDCDKINKLSNDEIYLKFKDNPSANYILKNLRYQN